MNEEQVKTQEFIFRNREDASVVKENKRKGGFKIVLAALAVVIAAGITAFAVSAKTGRGNEASENNKQTETIAKDTEPAITPEETQERTIAVTPSGAATEVALAGDPTSAHASADDPGSDDIIFDGGESFGLFGSAQDILDIYRADDPALPSYLTMTINEKFKMNLKADEIELLCHLVEAEAPAEDIFGKILVADVVLNRVITKGWANTVTGVIYEKCGNSVQFSSTAMKAYWNSIKITDSTREAVLRALSGEDYSDGAIFFFAWRKHPELTPTTGWISAYKYLFKHGGHAFYK